MKQYTAEDVLGYLQQPVCTELAMLGAKKYFGNDAQMIWNPANTAVMLHAILGTLIINDVPTEGVKKIFDKALEIYGVAEEPVKEIKSSRGLLGPKPFNEPVETTEDALEQFPTESKKKETVH